MKILIILDSLRIGGIERNALDQAYQLRDSNNSGILLVLNQSRTLTNANFVNTDKKLIEDKKVDIRYSASGFFAKIKAVSKILKTEDIDLVIDYSLIGCLVTQIAAVLATKRIVLNCVVQQFASLSAPLQRYKRMFYAQFATNLFMNSVNYGQDWSFYVNRNYINKIIFRKKFEIIRNGVYLPRLKNRNSIVNHLNQSSYRFIFLGRLKYWKGINNFKYIDSACDQKAHFQIIASENEPDIVNDLKDIFGERITFVLGKNLDHFNPQPGDIHIYPVDYGLNAPAIESVSTNCLEMAMLGIPSLVTLGGTANWLELKDCGFIHEVNWQSRESILEGIESCRNLTVTHELLDKIAQAVDISNNLSLHSSYI